MMQQILMAGLLGILTIGPVAWVAIVATRGRTWLRPIALLLVVLAWPVFVLQKATSLGAPVPLAIYWHLPRAPEGTPVSVLGYKDIVGEGIFILAEDEQGPIHLVMPWSKEASRQLQEEMQKGRGVLMEKGEPGDGQGGKGTGVLAPGNPQFKALPDLPPPMAKPAPPPTMSIPEQGM